MGVTFDGREESVCIMRGGRGWLQILGDVFRLLALCLRPKTSLAAENLFLRKQLAFYRTQGQAPACRQFDPSDAGSAQSVVQLAGRSDRGEAQDLRHLAPQGIPALLALEVRSWPAANSCRASTSDSKNGARESLVGRGADRQRAPAQARSSRLAANDTEVYAEVASGAAHWTARRPAVGDFEAPPRCRTVSVTQGTPAALWPTASP